MKAVDFKPNPERRKQLMRLLRQDIAASARYALAMRLTQ